jgi:hypothetical protein
MKLTTRTLVPLLLAAASGTALAQPGTVPQDDPSLTTPTPEEPPAPQPPPPPPETVPPPPPAPAPAPPVEDASTGRPVGTSLGLGIGYAFGTGTDLHQPNIASARVRFASGLTFEPSVVLGMQSTHSGATDSTNSVTQIDVGTGLRFPLAHRGKFDFELLGVVGIGVSVDNPDGDDNNTTTTRFDVGWGLAVSYWLTQHWDFSVGAHNSLFSYTYTKAEAADDGDSSFAVLAEWNPTVSVMMHLFY